MEKFQENQEKIINNQVISTNYTPLCKFEPLSKHPGPAPVIMLNSVFPIGNSRKFLLSIFYADYTGFFSALPASPWQSTGLEVGPLNLPICVFATLLCNL